MLRAARNPELFPSFVTRHSVTFDPENPDLEAQFPGVSPPASMHRAVLKRRVEYCAGRHCVDVALRACSPRHAGVAVPSGSHGEPLWPTGIVGAITHAHGFASVALARTEDARSVGLDAELAMDDRVAGDVLEHIASPEEIADVARTTRWSTAVSLSLVFSAKETIFKCLHREVGRYFDFRDVRFGDVDLGRGVFAAHLVVDLTAFLTAGTRLEGRFERSERWVYTGMVLGPRAMAPSDEPLARSDERAE
jgi:enterobactin synthetase component D